MIHFSLPFSPPLFTTSSDPISHFSFPLSFSLQKFLYIRPLSFTVVIHSRVPKQENKSFVLSFSLVFCNLQELVGFLIFISFGPSWVIKFALTAYLKKRHVELHRCCAWATLLHPLQLLQYRSCGIFDLTELFFFHERSAFFSLILNSPLLEIYICHFFFLMYVWFLSHMYIYLWRKNILRSSKKLS